ncbi:Inositol-1,4,5-trisphosphate 5-phosphatase 4 isoform 1 [Hibiscus syriacus]|uniref:Inositol-1,4,5-trisphosphate 5-phosphatase 4 isoform 1 n=1 Tax=Hibiscus syriacus TaxID=106335 RepID=A0A6A3D2M1_HIBSY|nr:Inositol-1,4,5-trisphosphate 5-phosphatase 4 isoform 1 [Hibiscus syriacus]
MHLEGDFYKLIFTPEFSVNRYPAIPFPCSDDRVLLVQIRYGGNHIPAKADNSVEQVTVAGFNLSVDIKAHMLPFGDYIYLSPLNGKLAPNISMPLKRLPARVPPGSLGLPLIGQSLGLLRAMRTNTAEEWLQKRIRRYGPVSKMSLFGKPAVFIYGQAANKFVFASDSSSIVNQQSLKRIGKMDEEVRNHLDMHWHGKEHVTSKRARREKLADVPLLIEGMWSIPVNLPFTRYNRSLKSSARAQELLKHLIAEKRVDLENGTSPRQDLITCLLSIRDEKNEQVITEKEIIHNVMLVMVAGYDLVFFSPS